MIEGSEDISSEEIKFIEECIGVYKDERDGIREDILGPVRSKMNKLMEKERVPIQYLRWRTKEPFSLRQKLIRKWEKYKNRIEDEKDVLDVITDLAGVRILVLYRNDIPIVNEKIFDIFESDIEECTAYYDEERHGDKEWFMDHGFYERIWYVKHGLHPDKHRDIWEDFKKLKIQGKSFEDEYEDDILDFAEKKLEGKPILEKTSRGYSSVHYIIKGERKTSCEIQLRTIHQDAWGEFDHELKYPHGYVDTLAENMIRRLSHLLNFAEDIVEDVRKTPANALFSHHLLNKHKNEDSVDKSSLIDEIVEVFLKKATYLGRSAPLAALTILRESTREIEGKTIGPRRRITTLDFGKPDNWKHQSGIDDPIRKIYLDAHQYWIQNPPDSDFIDGTEGRGIVKYLVWSNSNLEQVDDDNLVCKYNNTSDIEFRIFPEALMVYVHDVLDRIYPSVRLRSTQFFVWDTADEPRPIIINRRDFDEENSEDIKTCGFYSPAKTSDLTSGIVHLKTDPDNGDLESRVKRVRYENIKNYVTLLKKLHEKQIMKKVRNSDKGNVTEILSHEEETWIEDTVNNVFS